ncbi:MAG: ribosomal-protein-alanine N-acetyltransferase [Flammeovirgaceae bacterium]|jgi:ribosomal-protein-alanine N-acetyltransferase
MKFEEIITNRTILRKFTQESFDYIYSEMSQEEQLDILGITSTEELLKEKEKYKEGLSTHNKKFLYHQLIDKKTNKIIGWCGFHTWYTDHNRAEIGYGLFDDNYKGKGIMSEAIVPILNYGFNNMNLERIEAFVSPNNTPLIKLLTKMKFKKEGLLKHHYFDKNKMDDSIVFALLKSEYK